MIEIDDVFVAKMVFSEQTVSNSLNIFDFNQSVQLFIHLVNH